MLNIANPNPEDTLLRRSYRFNDQVQVYAVQEADLYAVLAEQAASSHDMG